MPVLDASTIADETDVRPAAECCRYCGSSNLVQEETPHTQHHAKEVCGACGRFRRWIPKPESVGTRRPANHRKLLVRYSRGFCELCLRKKLELPPGLDLEGHHIIEYQHGGSDERENVSILCSRCHRLTHVLRNFP